MKEIEYSSTLTFNRLQLDDVIHNKDKSKRVQYTHHGEYEGKNQPLFLVYNNGYWNPIYLIGFNEAKKFLTDDNYVL